MSMQLSPPVEVGGSASFVIQSNQSDCDNLDLDNLIDRIRSVATEILKGNPSTKARILEWEAISLCAVTTELLKAETTQLDVQPPVNICGDIHGQLVDLVRFFNKAGWPGPNRKYLFLGDYVDRGRHSLETIVLLLALKVKHPDSVYLLRGNHECASINRVYGFYDDCKQRYRSLRAWKSFGSLFMWLPITAVVGGKILCLHGGNVLPVLSEIQTDTCMVLQIVCRLRDIIDKQSHTLQQSGDIAHANASVA
eukprot:m.355772 g.355772  ORF g.355772 m.355772 type:complete len:252 (+) comp20738_c0_seq40:252-1007(+)